MATDGTFATRADPVLVRMPDRCRLAARVFGPEEAPPVLFVAGGDGGMLQWRGLIPELCVDDAERELFAAAGGWGEAEDAARRPAGRGPSPPTCGWRRTTRAGPAGRAVRTASARRLGPPRPTRSPWRGRCSAAAFTSSVTVWAGPSPCRSRWRALASSPR